MLPCVPCIPSHAAQQVNVGDGSKMAAELTCKSLQDEEKGAESVSNLQLYGSDSFSKVVIDDAHRGGWKGVLFILGNELVDRMINDGLHANFVSYFKDVYNMSQVSAATSILLIFGTSNLATLLAAYAADAYLGKFCTVLVASFLKMMGSLLLMTSALIPSLTPADNVPASTGQLAFLGFALCCTILAVGGIRPCSYALGADQFKRDDKINTQSYFNWYFFSLYVGSLLGTTVLVYVQDHLGWGWGFGVPSIFAALGVIILMLGIPFYKILPPLGSTYAGFIQVMVAAFCKRKIPLPPEANLYRGKESIDFYNMRLCHTNHLMCLDHAAIKTEKDFDRHGRVRSSFRLCTVQKVEELKALLNLGPILMIDMLVTTVLADQSGGFYVFQARTMDRRMFGSSFKIPAASIVVFTALTHVIWMPLYDRLIVPMIRRKTGDPRGITLLQRLGIGIFLSAIGLLVSGLVETKRRALAQQQMPMVLVPMSVFWLAPELCIKGLSDAFRAIAQLEFLHNQLPTNMHALGGAVYWCSKGVGHYMGIILLQLVHRYSKRQQHQDWLADDLSHGHLDYFFYLLAGIQCLFFFAFLIVSRFYTYK
ncbi:hypothetical protein L7F22_068447 [Adiantum nelumboides]|nr:hypothetical protein [Adiantum nelumboides]